jgi:hypothetical protein
MSSWRRFEVLLPVRFNDGRPVPEKWLAKAANEIVNKFGVVVFDAQPKEGRWRHRGKEYRDDLVRIIVDVPDTTGNRQWMKKFKSRWKERLHQLELWMVSYPIEIE